MGSRTAARPGPGWVLACVAITLAAACDDGSASDAGEERDAGATRDASPTESCSDGVRNRDETDVDCGGVCGATCAVGQLCGDAGDCVSRSCTSGTCDPAASCEDGRVSGTETDVDCGGLACPACDDGASCLVGSDCVSRSCEAGLCAAAICGDGIVNGDEACDDGGGGSPAPSATCDDDCTAARCGDGRLNRAAGEACDGDGAGTGGETASCNSDCTLGVCGDGIVNASAGEACDGDSAGMGGETAVCDDDCSAAMCGDAHLNRAAGEECDDGNADDADRCSDACVATHPDVVIAVNATFDTDTGRLDGTLLPGWSTTQHTLTVADFVVRSGVVLRVNGSRPFAIVAAGDVDVAGTIDASGRPGGAAPSCDSQGGAGGVGGPGGSRGGVGGGFGLTTIDGQPGQGAGGGSGATGDDAGGGGGGHDARGLDGTADGSGAPGVGGGTYVSFASLTGGSGGGGGSSDDDAPTGIDPTDDGGGGGGGGGGTVVIDALGDVSVSGHIDATGGPGGLSGCSAGDGGGGSGGTIVVTSPRRVIAPLARLDVRGGPGGVNSGAGGRGQVYAGAPPTCTDGVRNLDETDVDCGGIVCAGCPVRSACRVDSDCGAGDCVRGFCQAAHCGDGTRSGTETDADCGGPACLACGDGAMCAMDRDCVGTCDAATCVSCADGTRNQGESDVDCGGPACGGCADGATCSLDADCAGSGCEGGRCVSCVDGVLDDMETGVDCGGPECGGCAGGEPCHASRDCLSGMCTASTCTGDARSCAEILARYPGSPSGRYTIRPAPSELARAVWCDMTTDGGGWTLVGASFGTPLDDAASAYYADLATMAPSTANPGIWDGMRPLLSGLSDVRFTCTATYAGAPTAVDLSFYANDMYASFTAGDDAASCGRTYGGTAVPPYPARRDNATGRMQAEGDRFDCAADGVGPILEDFCGDTADFTVDFDDHGMDCDQGDGTDWGEDDGTPKCGQSGVTAGSWQVWVRE